MLGSTQLALLVLAMEYEKNHGSIDMKKYKYQVMETLNIRAHEQVVITMKRLLEKGRVETHGVSDYKVTEKGRADVAKSIKFLEPIVATYAGLGVEHE